MVRSRRGRRLVRTRLALRGNHETSSCDDTRLRGGATRRGSRRFAVGPELLPVVSPQEDAAAHLMEDVLVLRGGRGVLGIALAKFVRKEMEGVFREACFAMARAGAATRRGSWRLRDRRGRRGPSRLRCRMMCASIGNRMFFR
jgi:hypothetical protein